MQGRNVEKIRRKNPVAKHTDNTRRVRKATRGQKYVNLVVEEDEGDEVND